MNPTAQDFYQLFCNSKFKKFNKTLHEGFFGMYFVLRILAESKGSLSAGNISQAFGVTTARTAVILNNLEKKGFIKKTKSSKDARITIVNLTDVGTTILNERKSKLFDTLDKFLSKLNNVEKQDFYFLLNKLLTT